MTTPGGLMEGKVVMITGAGGGIGTSVCKLFAKEGAHIAAVDIHQENMEKALNALEGIHHSFCIDVGSGSAVTELMTSIQTKFNGKVPSVVVCLAGQSIISDFIQTTEEDFDKLISTHLKGTFLVMQAAAKCMIEQGVKDGSIITTSSIATKGKYKQVGAYAACKAGIIGLTKTAANEWARIPIRCNVIYPGFINTPLAAAAGDGARKHCSANTPLCRFGTPNEVAEACLFLASSKSSYITGTVLEVSGGY